MKKRNGILILWLLIFARLQAQNHDSQWVLGPNTSVLDFRTDTVTNYAITTDIPFYLTSACICDENGELLYTCYGSAVTDRYGDKLLNGDSLSPCRYTYENPNGFALMQMALFLPNGIDSRYYYLIHFSLDTNGPRPGTMYYSIIDKEANFGLGAVIEKNHPFHKEIFRGGGMTATKHANGRDWWLVIGKANSNKFYKYLLTSNGILQTLEQDIGPYYSGPFDNTYSCFSEDGTKYAICCYVGPITIMDFDRCTGEFSNPVTRNNFTAGFSSPGSTSLAFSPNGRFLYVSNRVDLKQYDLLNIDTTALLYYADSGDYAQMGFLELAPNGKIYGSTWNGGFYFLHVIHRPDEKGDSCDFVYAGQPSFTANSTVLPNMPNYRLGPLVGSGCDTIATDIRQQTTDDMQQPRVQPNPANKYFYTEMPMQGNYVFELRNQAGQLIERKETRQVDIFNTEDLPAGVYLLNVTDKNNTALHSNKKIVVQH